MSLFGLSDFVRESNRIEGIHRHPTDAEMVAHERLLSLGELLLVDIERFVESVEPGASLRRHPGMDVQVGQHIAPSGGHEVQYMLSFLLRQVSARELSPWEAHTRYECLHPFMDGNGRSGRAIWLWHMGGLAGAPLGFLHHFYYQTLETLQ